MSEPTITDHSNISELPHAYSMLEKQYKQLKQDYNQLCQSEHVMNLKLQAATKTNFDLSNELEAATKEHQETLLAAQAKHCKLLREQKHAFNTEIELLQMERDQMQTCIETLTERLKKAEQIADNKSQPKLLETESFLGGLECISKLKKQIAESDVNLCQAHRENARLSAELTNLNERYDELLRNYDCKQEDNVELHNLLEAAQEHGALLASEINGIRSTPEGDSNRKGNSLFAEVADGRKQLIRIIDSIKARYYALSAEHRDCPARMRKLRNAQHDLIGHIKQCQDMLERAENSYVQTLQQQNNQIIAELQLAHERNNYLQHQLTTNSAAWVNSLIDYSTEQINTLRARLMQCLTSFRLAEDEHLWRAQELGQVRMELVQLKLKNCNQQLDAMVESSGLSSDRHQEVNGLMAAISDESCSTKHTNGSTVETLETSEGSLKEGKVNDTAESSIKGEVLYNDALFAGDIGQPSIVASMASLCTKTECNIECQSKSVTESALKSTGIVAKSTVNQSFASGIAIQEIKPAKINSVVIRRYKIIPQSTGLEDRK